MRIFTDQTFGPVAPIVVVNDPEDALAVANNSKYGLQAGVFTNDVNRLISQFSPAEADALRRENPIVYRTLNGRTDGALELVRRVYGEAGAYPQVPTWALAAGMAAAAMIGLSSPSAAGRIIRNAIT